MISAVQLMRGPFVVYPPPRPSELLDVYSGAVSELAAQAHDLAEVLHDDVEETRAVVIELRGRRY